MNAPAVPAVGDPVVVDGVKYRIRLIDGSRALLRDRFTGHEVNVNVADLAWDRVAGVWRVLA